MPAEVAVSRYGPRPAGLSSPRAPSACATVCDGGGRLRPVRGLAVLKVSRNSAAASSLGTHPRAAFSFSRLAEPDRRCCRERGLARGRLLPERMHKGPDRAGGPAAPIFSTFGPGCEGAQRVLYPG